MQKKGELLWSYGVNKAQELNAKLQTRQKCVLYSLYGQKMGLQNTSPLVNLTLVHEKKNRNQLSQAHIKRSWKSHMHSKSKNYILVFSSSGPANSCVTMKG